MKYRELYWLKQRHLSYVSARIKNPPRSADGCKPREDILRFPLLSEHFFLGVTVLSVLLLEIVDALKNSTAKLNRWNRLIIQDSTIIG